MKATTAPPKATEEVQQPTTWIARVNLGRQMRDAGEKMIADALAERRTFLKDDDLFFKECETEFGWSRSTVYNHLKPENLKKDRDRAAAARAASPDSLDSEPETEVECGVAGYRKDSGVEPLTKAERDALVEAVGDVDKIVREGRAKWVPDRAGNLTILESVEPEPVVKKTGIPEAGSYTVKMWKGLDALTRETLIADALDDKPGKPGGMNKQTGDSIEWARFSLNTVTGCEHNCPYCYARDIAEKWYPQGFVPTFHPARLAAPAHVRVPEEAATDPSYRNVFANSMSDLFGKWVPADWIEATIEMARRHPQWNFLTLTKFPARAAEFAYPDNLWLGTSVDAQCRVEAAENAFDLIECKTKWLSCEPLLEPLTFKRLDVFQWVVIGGASASTKTPTWRPPFEWTARLHLAAVEAGCKVYHKTNLGLHDEIRVRDFPWAPATQPALPQTFRYLKGMGRRS